MDRVAVELTAEETDRLLAADIDVTKIAGSNFDGALVSTVLISLTSASTLKTVVPLLVEIVRSRRSGSIKINGLEIHNASEAIILKAVDKYAAE